MPGAIIERTRAKVSGIALHPYLSGDPGDPDLRKLAFLVGKTDEQPETSHVVPKLKAKRESPTGTEDMIYANVRRHWPYIQLRIESRVSGCPVQEDRGADQRVLLLNVPSALIAYQTSGSVTN